MNIIYQTFSLPKRGNAVADNEDSCCPSAETPELRRDAPTFSCAVADGATETCFSQYWAQLLTSAYVNGELTGDSRQISPDALQPLQSRWAQHLSGLSLPWYAAEKAQLGAGAALIGLTINEENHTWHAVAAGDSCLFHIRSGSMISSFPINAAAQFNSFPHLLMSKSAEDEGASPTKVSSNEQSGTWESGDFFLLMSDAIACWFLTQQERGCGAQSAYALCSIDTMSSFGEFIAAQRSLVEETLPSLRNDDVTLVRVRVAEQVAELTVPLDPPAPQAAPESSSEKRTLPVTPISGSGHSQETARSENRSLNRTSVADPKVVSEPPPPPALSAETAWLAGAMVSNRAVTTELPLQVAPWSKSPPARPLFFAAIGLLCVASIAVAGLALIPRSQPPAVVPAQQNPVKPQASAPILKPEKSGGAKPAKPGKRPGNKSTPPRKVAAPKEQNKSQGEPLEKPSNAFKRAPLEKENMGPDRPPAEKNWGSKQNKPPLEDKPRPNANKFLEVSPKAKPRTGAPPLESQPVRPKSGAPLDPAGKG